MTSKDPHKLVAGAAASIRAAIDAIDVSDVDLSKDFDFAKTPLLVELKARFDHIVGLDEHVTLPKGESVATFGMAGSIVGVIDNPDNLTFFHYTPLEQLSIYEVIKRHTNSETSKVHLFVPGALSKNERGRQEMMPKEHIVDRYLTATLLIPQLFKTDVFIHPYNDKEGFGGRYQSTVWLDEKGVVSGAGVPMHGNKVWTRESQMAPRA